MRKAFPTRLTESFNEGIFNTKPLKGRANRQWARGTLINGLVLRCASHGLLRLSDRINEHVVLYETMIPLIYIANCSLPPKLHCIWTPSFSIFISQKRQSSWTKLQIRADRIHERFGKSQKRSLSVRNLVNRHVCVWIYLDIDIPTVNQYNVWFVKWGMDCYW